MADLSERGDPDEEIMRATYRALREYGYADLTVKRIAEEYGKSTAAIHYHYDTKDDLLVAFLDYLLEQFVDSVRAVETTDPDRRLSLLLDELLVARQDTPELTAALLEMRSQAPHKPAFAERFRENDEYIQFMLKAVIGHGIDEGVFADVDADHVAQSLLTIVHGAHAKTVVAADPAPLETAREAAEEYVDAVLR